MENGFLKFVWSVKNSLHQFSIDSNITISNGMWHTIMLKFSDTKISLTIDEAEIFVENYEEKTSVTTDGLFYLGKFMFFKIK